MSHKDNGAPFRASMSDRVRVRAWFGAVLLNGGGMGCFVPVMGSAPGAPLWSPRGPNVWFVLSGVLLSRTLAGAVPSALSGLASGFGMGAGRFPVAVTTETTVRAVLHCRLCCGAVIRLSGWCPPTTRRAVLWCVWWVVGLGVDRIVDARVYCLCSPLSTRFACLRAWPAGSWARWCWGVVVCVGLLVPVSSADRCRSSTPGLSTQ